MGVIAVNGQGEVGGWESGGAVGSSRLLWGRGERVMAIIYADSKRWHHALSCWLAMANRIR